MHHLHNYANVVIFICIYLSVPRIFCSKNYGFENLSNSLHFSNKKNLLLVCS
ncbi:hypothetical protein RhiirC2_540613 [Rhizophagus irregularis]|uniref:Uncharacterized protein n=1 Tax=Rhizophagus irregularis TaxID=588596 RepID=A0A2N1N3H0_9GLOM|nr:hypothetical protein RhiirC2_540613 [Rhizophagus irregularis]